MELLDLALSLELDLEKYYNEQAEKNKENNLKVVFTMLAAEEEKHANILLGKADKLTLKIDDDSILIQAKDLFQNLGDFKSVFTDIPSQLDSYRLALEMENKSKKFYQNLYDLTEDKKTKKIYGYLVHQEDLHCIIMEELVKLTTRPEEWVESAEFGLREDY